MSYSIEWAHVDLNNIPHIRTTELPGPKSQELHKRAAAIMKGYSGQVKLFPVVFENVARLPVVSMHQIFLIGVS